MNGGKIGTVTVAAKKVDFGFSFTVAGLEKVSGKTSLTLKGTPDQEQVRNAIDEYVTKRIFEFIESNSIDSENIQIEVNIDPFVTSDMKIEMQMNAAR